MARAIILAEGKKPRGVFTSPLKLWNALEELEGLKPSDDSKEAAAVTLGQVFVQLPRGEKEVTYSRLSTAMRNDVDFRIWMKDEDDEMVCKYVVFQLEANELRGSEFSSDSKDDESEEE